MLARRAIVLLSVLGAGCAAPAPSAPPHSAARPQIPVAELPLLDAPALAGAIVFHSDREGRNKLFTLDLRSRRVTRLTGGRDHHDEEPAPSPDGRRVAFATTRFDYRTWDIAVLDVNGGEVTRVTTHIAFEKHPAWSPDGRALLFSSEQDGTQAVFRAAVEEGTVARVSPAPDRALMPAVSPDGRYVAYTAGSPDGLRIATQDLSGTAPRFVTPAGIDAAWPRWSPDGSRLAFARLEAGGTSDIGIVALASGELRAFAVEGFSALREPAWSPDGRSLVVAASARDAAQEDWDLVLLAPEAASAFRLTAGGAHDRAPVWVPR